MHIAVPTFFPLLLWSQAQAASVPSDPEAPTADVSVTDPAPAPTASPPEGSTPTSAPSSTTPSDPPPPPDPAPSPPAPSTVEVVVAPPAAPVVIVEAPVAPKPELPTFEFGVQGFLRGEVRGNPDFNNSNDNGPDPALILQRIRLQMLARYKFITVFAQLQDFRTFGFEQSTVSNEGNTDLHQGYVEMGGKTESGKVGGWARVGRQEIIWGNSRLIGNLDWLPSARSFDGLRGHLDFGKFGVDAFAVILEFQQRFDVLGPDGEVARRVANNGTQLYGAQIYGNVHPLFNFEVQILGTEQRPIPSANTRRMSIASPGARVFGASHGFNYEAEAHVQGGKSNGLDHLAWAWQANIGYALERVKTAPGLSLGYAMASGSECTGERVAGTAAGCNAEKSKDFFNFYPTNHLYYGFADLMGWVNMRELHAKFSLKPHTAVSLVAAYHFFQLQESRGAWKNAPGALVGGGWSPTNEDHSLGHEIDITMNVKPFKQMMLQPGYGVFIPTAAGRTLGGPDPQHFAWLWMIITLGSA